MKVVLITGAASGLGWEMTQRCHARGDAVVLVDRNAALLAQRQQQLDEDQRVLALAGDLTDEGFLQQLPVATQNHFGALHVLINNAGITHRSPAAQTDTAVLQQVMAIDWQAPMQLALAALPLLKASQGSIVNIGSMAGWMPVPGRAAYCAAKGALGQFFEVLRLELESDGVHILNIYPSFLDTPIESNALGADGQPAQHARSTVGSMRGADWMAERVLQALQQRKLWLFPDRLSWFGSCLWRLWPSRYLKIVRRRFAVELNP